MTRIGWLVIGALLGALAVLIAGRTPQGRAVVGRADQSLQAFLDGVAEGYREQSR